jgi:hypothetical protein
MIGRPGALDQRAAQPIGLARRALLVLACAFVVAWADPCPGVYVLMSVCLACSPASRGQQYEGRGGIVA